ncbi:MAG: bifunctional folylpolyglutamate synthase/dihydrofolate synthase [Alphaproteobacteria bacterium]|nr:bifunctional folylpolyglutamate synthase/dihydrofolate synthase [Alphaproteobacteria bacterium]
MIKEDINKVLKRLESLHPRVIDLSLGRTLKLLEKLGNPHTKLPPVIHVAGTNGKGSVIAFIRSILEAAGLSVHVFTSPHLVNFNERIRLAGELIDDNALHELLERTERINNGDEITFFEITTCAAFLAFHEHPADVVILETGLGGRLDSTNVIEKPALTVITPISIDHCGFLGNTIEQIAEEKAHIIKEGVNCVVAEQPYVEASKIIKDYAAKKNVALHMYSTKNTIINDLPTPSLIGNHQIKNAETAITAIKRLIDNKSIPKLETLSSEEITVAIKTGIQTAKWSGRMQNISSSKFANGMPTGSELWVDGGHNASAGLAVADIIKDWDDMPLYIVLGMLTTKDALSFIRPIAKYAKEMHAVEVSNSNASFDVHELAEIAKSAGAHKTIAAGSFQNAIEMIKTSNNNQNIPYRILICGSLYLIGSVLEDA